MLTDNLVKTIEASLRDHWDLPALSDYQHEPLTYGAVAAQIIRLHQLFGQHNLKKGAKIALVGRNSANWGVVYLATVTYGAVIVPILPDFTADSVQHIVNHSEAQLLFAADAIYDRLDVEQLPRLEAVFSLANLRLLHSRRKHPGQAADAAAPPPAAHEAPAPAPAPDTLALPEVANDELESIVYTSGTTGFSKGVMLTHNSLMANLLFARANIHLRAGDRIVSFMPLAHSYGCAFEFLFPIVVGCHITMLGRTPSPKVILEAFQAVRPRLILSVPLVIEKIYRKQVRPVLQKPAVRWMSKVPPLGNLLLRKIGARLQAAFGGEFLEIVVGGAALDPEVEAFFMKVGFPFTIGYGMTECGPLISYSSARDHRPLSAGRPIEFLELKIDSADPHRVVGDVLVRGENVMLGYYKNEAATREVLSEDGWLNTGDLGTIDQDGHLYLRGRSKNMILGPSGQNIYPEEIEAQLNNLPLVQESLVLQKEGRLMALVYPDLEQADARKLDEGQIRQEMEANRQLLNRRLPAYSTIASIELYPQEFEKTPTRKIKRFLYEPARASG